MIEILNKGAEGGIYTTCASVDPGRLAKRSARGRRLHSSLATLNNLIVPPPGRDRPTQDFRGGDLRRYRDPLRVGLTLTWAIFRQSPTQITESFEEMIPAGYPGSCRLQYFIGIGRAHHQDASVL